VKREQFLKHLRKNGCTLLREGGNHSWWVNAVLNRRSSVPRHSEIDDSLAVKICRDLGIPSIKEIRRIK